MPILTPTTELEAVNLLLGMIEEERVNSLLGSLDPDVGEALATLSESSRMLQAQGWFFNVEPEFKLDPATTGIIAVPPDVISFDVSGVRIAIRAGRLYDRDAKTATFTASQTGRAILLLPFEDMPQQARYFVTLDAAFKFLGRKAPDEITGRFAAKDLERAFANFHAEDTRQEAASFSMSSSIASRQRP